MRNEFRTHIEIQRLLLCFILIVLIFYSKISESALKCQSIHDESIQLSKTSKERVEKFKNVLQNIKSGEYTYMKAYIGKTKVESLYQYVLAWYGEKIGVVAYQKLVALKLLDLVVDPAIVMRLTDFEKFVVNYRKENVQDKVDPWLLRQKFSEYLGTIEMYRSMALTEDQVNTIKFNGLLSGSLRKEGHPRHDLFNGLQTEVATHSAGFSSGSDYISVTTYPTLAIAIAKTFLKNESQKNLYLVKMKIPILDLIHFDDVYKIKDYNLALRINLTKVPVDYKLESFIYMKIPTEQILQITQISKSRQLLSTYEHISADESVFSNIINQVRSLWVSIF